MNEECVESTDMTGELIISDRSHEGSVIRVSIVDCDLDSYTPRPCRCDINCSHVTIWTRQANSCF